MKPKTPETKLWREKIAAAWSEFHWPILGCLWVLALSLGYWGFQKQNHDLHLGRAPVDDLYRAFMLFTMNPVENDLTHWTLQLARWLAPLVALFAVLQTVAVIFREQIQEMQMKHLQGHVVICGLGRKRLAAGRIV